MNIRKRLIQLTITAVATILAAMAWSFSFGETGFWNQYKLKKQIAHLEFEADSLKKILEIRQLEGERLQKDSFYIESIARTQFGMSKKGEDVYQFIDD